MKKLIDIEAIEAAAEEMSRIAKECHKGAIDNPTVGAIYTAQAMSAEMAAAYIRDVLKKHAMVVDN